jgi:hypothetical protein
VLVFDTNTLATYRTTFAEDFEVVENGTVFRWRGEADDDFLPGDRAAATVEVLTDEGVLESRHVQRHWPVDVLRDACRAAGFEHVVFRGQLTGGRLMGDPDEDRHTKVLCLAARPNEAVPA